MNKIIYIIGENKAGERWCEKVCSDKDEAIRDIEFLKNRKIVPPEMDSSILNELGLSFQERNIIIEKIVEFREIQKRESPTYRIDYEYLYEDKELDYDYIKDKLTIKVIEVSEVNYQNQYIHTVVELDITSGEALHNIYKISLPKITQIGTIDTISLNDFKIVEIKKGFQYSTRSSDKQIDRPEKWLFIKRPGD